MHLKAFFANSLNPISSLFWLSAPLDNVIIFLAHSDHGEVVLHDVLAVAEHLLRVAAPRQVDGEPAGPDHSDCVLVEVSQPSY